jgi:hypothetical protein
MRRSDRFLTALVLGLAWAVGQRPVMAEPFAAEQFRATATTSSPAGGPGGVGAGTPPLKPVDRFDPPRAPPPNPRLVSGGGSGG